MRGEDFLIRMDGKPELLGFYQTIYLEAPGPDEAEREALDTIRKSNLRDVILEDDERTPMIYLERMEEIETFQGVEALVGGRAFFPMSDLRRRWWQFWK